MHNRTGTRTDARIRRGKGVGGGGGTTCAEHGVQWRGVDDDQVISSISGMERGEVRGVFWTDSGPCHVTHVRLLIRRTDDLQAD